MNEEDSKPYNKELLEDIERIKDRVRRGKASLIILDGGVGEGKTTLAVKIADQIEGQPIVLEEQLAMGGQDFMKKLGDCYRKQHKVIIYDEAGDYNKRGSLTKLNAMLNRVFETFRAFKIIVIIVLPNFSVLDNDLFLKNIPRLLIHTSGRTETYGNYTVYSLSRMLVMKEKMTKMYIKNKAYYAVPGNYRGHFKDLDAERSAELDRYSTKGKLFELEKASTKIEGLVSVNDLMLRFGLTKSSVCKLLHRLDIKPVRKANGKNYYPMETIRRVEADRRRKEKENIVNK